MKNKKRILLCRLGGIGDVIHTLPLVKYLRKKYESASIEYITSENVGELLEKSCPYIDKVWVYDRKNKKQLVSELSANTKRVDYFFNLHSSLTFFFFNLFYVRAKKFFQYEKDNCLHAVINFVKTYDDSISAFNLDSKTLFVDNSNEILSSHNLKEGRYVCFIPGVGSVRSHRGWMFENWLSLTKEFLHLEKDFKVVFLGGEHEKKIFQAWIKLRKEVNAGKDDEHFRNLPGFQNRAVNLTGSLGLSDVAKLFLKLLV